MEHPKITPREIALQGPGNGLGSEIENLALTFLATRENISEAHSSIERAQEHLRNLVAEYEKNRLALFISRLLEHGLGWCYGCKYPHVLHELKLMGRPAVRHLQSYDHERGGWQETFFRIHTVCPVCYEAAFDDESASRIEVTKDGVFVRKGKELQALPEKIAARSLPHLRESSSGIPIISKDILERFDIPPEITYVYDGAYPKIRIGDVTYGDYAFNKPELVLTK